MDLRKTVDYRPGYGASPPRDLSSTAHQFRIEQRSQERRQMITGSERAAGRTTSPYQGSAYGVPAGARPATAAYGGLDSAPSGRFDDRHEELKKQIALKEKLLHDMTADRESSRRLRYANVNKASGSIQNTINRDRQSEASLHQQAQRSPTRGAASTNGFTGMRSTHLSGGLRSYERAGGDPGFETGMPQGSQQQLQFSQNPGRPNFTAGGSPLRNKRSAVGGNSKSRSRSRGVAGVRVDDVGNAPFTSSYAPNRMTKSFVEEQVTRRLESSPMRSRSPLKPMLVSEPSFIPPIGGPIDGRDRLYRERVEAMTLDNASLQRRLNGVTADMQRAKLDVEGMMSQLRGMEHKNDNIHRSVGNRDETDMSNQALQDELDRRREENRRMQGMIAEEQGANSMTHNRLDSTNMQKQNLQFESSNLGADLRKKACVIEDMSRELISIQSKINMGVIEIENLNREDGILNREVIDISAIIGRIQAERQDAADRVHDITMTLDELLQNNESDRHQLELKRRWQSKTVTARIFEQTLVRLSNSRINVAYQELREYAKFDRNCHNKLKAFAKVAHRLGLYRLRVALNSWYDASLKPLAQISQNQDIALMGECNRLQAKTFYAWRQYLQRQHDKVKLKAAGADRVWAVLVRNCKLRKKRAVTIWKEGQLSIDQRMYRLRHAVRKVHEKSMRRAFSNWLGYSERLEQAVRMKVMHRDATQRLLVSQTFHQLKLAVHRERAMRLRSLRHTVKAWRAHVRYNRHLMLVNMSAIQFVRTNQRYIMKNCFDYLRQNKEVRKHKLLSHAVNNEVNPAIATLEQYSYDKSQQILKTNTIRACTAIRDQLNRRIYSYMLKWMKESGHYKIAIRSACAARITRNYRNNMLWAFDRWRKQLLKRETQLRQAINHRLGGEVELHSGLAHDNERDLRFKEECIRTAKRRLLEKTMRKFQERRLQVCIGRWMDICNIRTTQEDQLAKVIMRQRKRQLRAAYDYYIEFNKWSRQHDKNMNGMLYLRHKANAKLMQRVFNGLAWYTQRNKRAHRYWTMILDRMDCFMRKRAIAIWRENAGLSYEQELARIQDQEVDAVFKRNQLICSMEKHSGEQEDYISAQQKLRRSKGYRQLGNYFVRTMQDKMLEKFRHWRQLILDKKHKQTVIRKTLDHWKRHSFHMAAMMFKKFVTNCHIDIYNEEVRKKRQEQDMLQHNILFEKQQHDENVEAAKGTLQALEEDISLRKSRAAKLMFILERRNREWIFISRQRRIFNEWRDASKKQKGFCAALENLIQKQLFMKGFHYIKNAAKVTEYETRIHRTLRLYALKRQKFNQADAFNNWKLYSLSAVDERSNAAILELRARNLEHQDYIKQVKRTNMARVFAFLQDQNLANVWHAWKNVIKQMKQLKMNQREFRERQARMQKINVINKWYLRKNLTLRNRANEANFKRIQAFKMMRNTFKALRRHVTIDKTLSQGNNRLERFMRQKIFQDAFKNIKSFATSKTLVYGNLKSKGAQKILEALRYHYGSDLEAGWQQYKNQVFKHRRQKELLKRVTAFVLGWRKRMAFRQWREQDQKEALCDDNYFIGPVRAEQWEASREVENLKSFMRHEQFDENHVEEVVNKAEKGTTDLMLKYASRMRIKRHQDKRILPWFLDRWKKYVALRKLYRHIFRNCYNRTNNVRADLQYAFNRWKYKPLHLRSQLEKLSTPMLKEISLLTTKKIDQCSDQLYENQSISNHLMVQRDEFLNYYIKSQILAMALVKDRARNTQMQAWGRWFDKRRAMNKLDLMREIRDAAYLHANLKAREAELTKKNSELKNENLELKVFRDDAAVVRQNQVKLYQTTQEIRIQITETDGDYQRLLLENQRLKKLAYEAEGATRTSKNRKYLDLYHIKYHDEKDTQEVENMKPAGERKEHLFTSKKEGELQYETEQERKNKERFAALAAKLTGASIR